jgi:hypothetical protein
MHQLLYVSRTPRDIAPDMLDDILAVSRANNVLLGITVYRWRFLADPGR